MLPISETLSALIHTHPGHGEIAFMPEDNSRLLFYIRCMHAAPSLRMFSPTYQPSAALY